MLAPTYRRSAAMGLAATFSPLTGPEVVGNGVHIHLSLWTPDGQPVTYDADGQDALSVQASAFIAGILRHLNAVSALTAPSGISTLRLTPHRWSAAFNNLGVQDREAAIRICPVSTRDPDARARQFNFEFRAADAAASPYLALAALVAAINAAPVGPCNVHDAVLQKLPRSCRERQLVANKKNDEVTPDAAKRRLLDAVLQRGIPTRAGLVT